MKMRFIRTAEITDKVTSRTRFSYRTMAHSLIVLAVVAALAIPFHIAMGQSATDSSKAHPAPQGNAQNGRKLFVRDGCFECHGREAQGGGLNGPRLAPDPIPLEALLQFVRNPGGEMPPYTPKVISDKDLTDIYAFLSSQPQPPPLSSIPILKH